VFTQRLNGFRGLVNSTIQFLANGLRIEACRGSERGARANLKQ
jgi:hypothetical protein